MAVFSEQAAPRETCIASGSANLSLMSQTTTLMSESWGLQGYLFRCLFPSSSTVPGTNAWHRWGGGDLQPNNQDSQACPIQLAGPRSSGIHRILSVLPWACTTSGMWLLKGHTWLRSKERFWDVRFRTRVASLRESCSRTFVFALNSYLPAYSDAGELGGLCRKPGASLHGFLFSPASLPAPSRGSPTHHHLGRRCPLPRCTPLPKWNIILLLFLSGLPLRFFLSFRGCGPPCLACSVSGNLLPFFLLLLPPFDSFFFF